MQSQARFEDQLEEEKRKRKAEKEREAKQAKRELFHQQSILVVGFFGAIAFTAMVLVFQGYSTFQVHFFFLSPKQFFHLLIGGLAISTIFFIFSSVGMIDTASGRLKDLGLISRFISWTFAFGFCILLIMIGLVILAVSKIAFYTLLPLAIILAYLLVLARAEQNNPKGKRARELRWLERRFSSLRSSLMRYKSIIKIKQKTSHATTRNPSSHPSSENLTSESSPQNKNQPATLATENKQAE